MYTGIGERISTNKSIKLHPGTRLRKTSEPSYIIYIIYIGRFAVSAQYRRRRTRDSHCTRGTQPMYTYIISIVAILYPYLRTSPLSFPVIIPGLGRYSNQQVYLIPIYTIIIITCIQCRIYTCAVYVTRRGRI